MSLGSPPPRHQESFAREFAFEQRLETACTVGFKQQFPNVQSVVTYYEKNGLCGRCSVKKQSGCRPYQGLYGGNMHR